MRHSPIKKTPEVEALLMREATLRSQSMTIKQIARTIGASRTYVQEHLSRMVSDLKEGRKIVPRGTDQGGG